MHTPIHLLREDEVEFTAVRAQGAGGQNVNKVSSAVHLRYDIPASSLPSEVKQRLLASADQRINAQGVLVIKAQTHRSQGRNRAEALTRLRALIDDALQVPLERRATRPTGASKRRRLQDKAARGQLKRQRGGAVHQD